MKFTHLHTHSHYSLLQGLSKIDDLVLYAKRYKMDALSLTDYGNLYAAIPFYKKCKKENIKPIIGSILYVSERKMDNMDPGPNNRIFHITALVKNDTGYRNLLKIITEANLRGYYIKPRIDKEFLKKHKDGIIILSGDPNSEVQKALWNNDIELARKIIREYKEIFGEDYYIEISHFPKIERYMEIRDRLIEISRKENIPLVATQPSFYINKDDKEAHETLLKVSPQSESGYSIRFLSEDEDFSFIDSETAEEYFRDMPDAIQNTKKIAEKCNLEFELGKPIFPNIETEKGLSHDEQLRKFTLDGIADRKLKDTRELRERIEYELKVIENKGYAPYFLVVADLIYFARHSGILSTIRGSVAGSIVTYLTKITNVNPLEYNLPFERFLNPERPSAPDIDMDFADDGRDEVISYAKDKYGKNKVAQIGTFGTMMARGVVRDVARALSYPYTKGDTIAKLIPFGSQGFPMTIDNAMKLSPDLRDMYENDLDTKKIINLAKKLEGCVRHCSVHAAGVVISPVPLTEHVPLQREPRGEKIITQYDMHSIEDIGLVKFDFLGIRNLSILSKAVAIVKKTRNVDIDIENVPLGDEKTFELLSKGETMGLFQLNGSGMTHFLKELKPTSVNDINAMIALYRPGPMKNIPDYIDRKHGRRKVTYYHPKMKKFLEKSYGILVYQDDLLSTALDLAGYTWETVDAFRKAVGKKIPKEMAKQHKIFVKGCMETSGMTEKEAEGLWDLFEPFQGYGFNKAHAACYGKLAYQTAYMKANFPAEYMTAVLTAESGDIDEISRIVSECKRMEIEVLPPDINESRGDFTIVKGERVIGGNRHGYIEVDKIRFGLYTIKNLGKEISDVIIKERKTRGKYKNFSDFLDRIHNRNLNKKSLEALIKSGSMDSIGKRGQMLENIDNALSYNRDNKKDSDQNSLFGLIEDKGSIPDLKLKEGDPATQEEMLSWEKEHLGLYVSGHPLHRFSDRFKDKDSINKIKETNNNNTVTFGGVIEDVRNVVTKRNEQMSFIKVSDFDGNIEVVFFPSIYQNYKNLLKKDECVAIQGKVSDRNGERSVIAEKIKLL